MNRVTRAFRKTHPSRDPHRAGLTGRRPSPPLGWCCERSAAQAPQAPRSTTHCGFGATSPTPVGVRLPERRARTRRAAPKTGCRLRPHDRGAGALSGGNRTSCSGGGGPAADLPSVSARCPHAGKPLPSGLPGVDGVDQHGDEHQHGRRPEGRTSAPSAAVPDGRGRTLRGMSVLFMQARSPKAPGTWLRSVET